MAIGQGEVGITPLQMANMTAAIANRGYYYTSHVVKSVGADHLIDNRFISKHNIDVDSSNFETIVSGMENAVKANGNGSNIKRYFYNAKQELHRTLMGITIQFLLPLPQRRIRKLQLLSMLKTQGLVLLMLLR